MCERSSASSLRFRRPTFLSSTMMVPRSGWISPMMCLRSTLLPVPDGPSRATVSPSRTSKSTPSRTTCLPKRLWTFLSSIMTPLLVEQQLGEHDVEQQDHHRAAHDRARGGPSHPLRSLLGV